MFFHIDESGNTGLNFFDEQQPRLSYGVLSSKLNVDVLGATLHRKMIRSLGVDALHATDLRAEGLAKISDQLLQIQKKCNFRFDYYFIDKRDFALVLFFQAVFDAELNEAVKWDFYWTPMRYLALQKLAYIFDEDLLRESLALCLIRKNQVHKEADQIVNLLSRVYDRVLDSPIDARSKELFSYALRWGINNPLKLDFGVPDRKMVAPNTIGFQFVVQAIARRSRSRPKNEPTVIRVDRQQQFNKSQDWTYSIYSIISESLSQSEESERNRYRNHPIHWDILHEDLEFKGLPSSKIEFHGSDVSIGIQLVDIYLWITNQFLQGREIPPELARFARSFLRSATADGISIDGMARRFLNFKEQLPPLEELSDEQLEKGHENVSEHREKVGSILLDEE